MTSFIMLTGAAEDEKLLINTANVAFVLVMSSLRNPKVPRLTRAEVVTNIGLTFHVKETQAEIQEMLNAGATGSEANLRHLSHDWTIWPQGDHTEIHA